MDHAEFERLVGDALDSLPADIAEAMENVDVLVEDEPAAYLVAELDPGQTLFGLYHGVPLTARGLSTYFGAMPDRISIYKGPLTRAFHHPDDIRNEVRITVIHEIAHPFGISHERLDELGW